MANLWYDINRIIAKLLNIHVHTTEVHTIPVSTTYFTPGIVRDVSATFVATTHSRTPSGGATNTCTHTCATWDLLPQVNTTKNSIKMMYCGCYLEMGGESLVDFPWLSFYQQKFTLKCFPNTKNVFRNVLYQQKIPITFLKCWVCKNKTINICKVIIHTGQGLMYWLTFHQWHMHFKIENFSYAWIQEQCWILRYLLYIRKHQSFKTLMFALYNTCINKSVKKNFLKNKTKIYRPGELIYI